MEVLNERQKTHGNFADVAVLDQSFKHIMYGALNWERLSNQQKLALEMICHKASRILCGNPDEADHWKDIAGYATLGERSCAE